MFWGMACACVILLFFMNLLSGAVDISAHEVLHILFGDADNAEESIRFIILDSRLPQAVTALLCGSSLAVCGLMLQTIFRNPLADPSILGISSGAGLGVALVMLLFGGGITIGAVSVGGFLAVLLAAFAGALAVAFVMYFLSTVIRSNSALLVAGIIFGYVASSAIALLNFFATEDGIRAYMAWGLGSFGGIPASRLPMFAIASIVAIGISALMVKPLNVLVLGEQYAENLGVKTVALRNRVLIVTGLLTAVTTAFCGPISFLGLAVPHIARMALRTDDFRLLIPSVIVFGGAVALLCNYCCNAPFGGTTIPINIVTPIVGAPVVVYVMVKGRKLDY